MKDSKDPIRHHYVYGSLRNRTPSSLNALIEALHRMRVQVLKAGQDPDEVLLRYLDGEDLDADVETLELAFFPDDEMVDLLITFSGRTKCRCANDVVESDVSPLRWLGRQVVC